MTEIERTILRLEIMLDNEVDYQKQEQIINMINTYKKLLINGDGREQSK